MLLFDKHNYVGLYRLILPKNCKGKLLIKLPGEVNIFYYIHRKVQSLFIWGCLVIYVS